jgi:1,2-diacylglycerol 3-alpha-glucosyltransferase
MKILICSFEYPPHGSGIANVAYNLAQEFSKNNKVQVCSPDGPDIRKGWWALTEKTGGIGIIYYWWQIGRFLKKNMKKYDVVLLENPLLLHKIYSPKIHITTHTSYAEYWHHIKASATTFMRIYYFFMRKLEQQCFARLDKRIKFTSASDDVTKEIIRLGIPEKNILYISNGADTPRFKPVDDKKKKSMRAKYGLDKDKPTFIFVGRLEAQHRPVEMIRIFDLLRKKKKCQLLVIGKGSLDIAMKQEVEKLKTPDVIFIPRIEYKELHQAYQAADFFLLNSIYTGQSLAMLEAVAAGCALVVPDITEFKRIVKDSGTGCLYPSKNIEKAAKEILKYAEWYLKNQKQEQKKQRAYAEKKISWQNVAKEYLDYFRKNTKKG